MIKVLQIRETPKTKCGGIDANCRAIESAFLDDPNIYIHPIMDFPSNTACITGRGYISYSDVSNAVKQLDPDIIHIHGSYTYTVMQSILAAVRNKKKVVYSPHFHPFYALTKPVTGKVFFHLFIRPFLKLVDTVITINDEDTHWFEKYHQEVIRIPHWSKIDLNKHRQNDAKKGNMILFVGRINDPVKGIEHIYSLPEGTYDIHCIGKGDLLERSDITQHINISDEEMLALYKEASLLVVPSRYEAFSYVSVEALSCGTPIVVSDRVRISDYFENCKYVQTFNYGDTKDFIAAVKRTIGEEVDLEYVSEVFNHNRLKELYKEVYMGECDSIH